jgi:hypothetical protein
MASGAALSGNNLDWERELCKQGCREWIPWYRNKKGKTVYGCRIGEIPRKDSGRRYCSHRKRKRRRSINQENSEG